MILKSLDGNNFVPLQSRVVRDRLLSLKAKGLLSILLDNPKDWKFYHYELIKRSSDGKDSFNSAMKELIKAGYVFQGNRYKNSKGYLQGYLYAVSCDKKKVEKFAKKYREKHQKKDEILVANRANNHANSTPLDRETRCGVPAHLPKRSYQKVKNLQNKKFTGDIKSDFVAFACANQGESFFINSNESDSTHADSSSNEFDTQSRTEEEITQGTHSPTPYSVFPPPHSGGENCSANQNDFDDTLFGFGRGKAEKSQTTPDARTCVSRGFPEKQRVNVGEAPESPYKRNSDALTGSVETKKGADFEIDLNSVFSAEGTAEWTNKVFDPWAGKETYQSQVKERPRPTRKGDRGAKVIERVKRKDESAFDDIEPEERYYIPSSVKARVFRGVFAEVCVRYFPTRKPEDILGMLKKAGIEIKAVYWTFEESEADVVYESLLSAICDEIDKSKKSVPFAWLPSIIERALEEAC